ncbi:MAG: hypothetical protein ACFFAJ_09665 [Candidatus Hodarchaeota archaeon]
MTEPQNPEENPVLFQILEEIKRVSEHLVLIEKTLTRLNGLLLKFVNSEKEIAPFSDNSTVPSSLDILELQDSRPGIFKTYKALQKEDSWVKADKIAKRTNRSRGLESRYLNYLTERGIVLKKREKVDPNSKATEVLYKIVGVDT